MWWPINNNNVDKTYIPDCYVAFARTLGCDRRKFLSSNFTKIKKTDMFWYSVLECHLKQGGHEVQVTKKTLVGGIISHSTGILCYNGQPTVMDRKIQLF